MGVRAYRQLLAAMLVASLLVVLAVPAALAGSNDVNRQYEQAVELLTRFRIIEGDPDNNLRPLDAITRAEMAKVLVAAAGRRDDARFLAGAPAFPDTADHWASGYVALARNAGWISGYPDGTFKPDQRVTYAEAVTLLVRFVRRTPSAGVWPNNYLSVAEESGIVDPAVNIRNYQDASANRGSVFILAHAAFLQVPVGPQGENVYQLHHDRNAPDLKVAAVESPTTLRQVKVEGSATDAVKVLVNGEPVELGPGGTFATDVELAVGNNDLLVAAVDDVGNEARHAFKVERANSDPTAIAAPAAIEVVAGETITLDVAVHDADGEPIAAAPLSAEVTAEVTAEVGSFNAADRTFTAGTKAGSGKLILTSGDLRAEIAVTVKPAAPVAVAITPASIDLPVGVAHSFTAQGIDKYGNVTGAVTPEWSTAAGKAIIDTHGNFTATSSGLIKVTATTGDLRGEATVNAFGSAARLNIAAAAPLVANGVSTTAVTVTAEDAGGNRAAGFNGKVTLRLASTAHVGFDGGAGRVNPGVLSQTLDAVGGVATFTLQANTLPGDTLVSAGAGGLAGATQTVTTAAQILTGYSLSADPVTLSADASSSGTVTVRFLDQTGNPYLGTDVAGYWTAGFTSSDPSILHVVQNGTVHNGNRATLTGAHITSSVRAQNNTGSAAINVTVRQGNELRYTDSVIVSTQLVGQPYRIVADPVTTAVARQVGGDQHLLLSFRVLDVNGNQITRLNSFDRLALRLTAGDNRHTVVLNPAGTGVAARHIPGDGIALSAANADIRGGRITVRVASAQAQTVRFALAATHDANTAIAGDEITVARAEVDGTFVAGPAHRLSLRANPDGSTDVIPTSGQAMLIAEIRDDADLSLATYALSAANRVPTGAYDVTFQRTAGNTTLWPGDQVVTAVNGVAQVAVSAGSAMGEDRFTARFVPGTGISLPSNPVKIRVGIVGVPHRLQVTNVPADAVAGGSHTVVVKVQDAQPQPRTVTNDSTTPITLTVTDGQGQAYGPYVATADRGVATFTVTGLTRQGTYSVAATAPGLVSAGRDYDVIPAAATKLVGVLATTTIAAAHDSSVSLRLYPADEFGNIRRDDVLANVTTHSSDTSIFTVSTPNATTDGLLSTIAGTANIGSATLTARAGGLDEFTTTITSVIVGDARFAQVIVDQGGTVGHRTDDNTDVRQRVRVRVTDANGNLVTQRSKQPWIRLEVTGDGYTSANTALYTAHLIDETNGIGSLVNRQSTAEGEATFYVNTEKAGFVTYAASIVTPEAPDTPVAGTVAGGGTGSFAAAAPDRVVVSGPSPTSLLGDGSSTAVVTAAVTDAFGNPTVADGTFAFTLTPGALNHAYLQGAAPDGTLTVSSASGQATVIVQSQRVTSPREGITVSVTFTPADNGTHLTQPVGTSAPFAVELPPL